MVKMSQVWHILNMGTNAQEKADEFSLSHGQPGSARKDKNHGEWCPP